MQLGSDFDSSPLHVEALKRVMSLRVRASDQGLLATAHGPLNGVFSSHIYRLLRHLRCFRHNGLCYHRKTRETRSNHSKVLSGKPRCLFLRRRSSWASERSAITAAPPDRHSSHGCVGPRRSNCISPVR